MASKLKLHIPLGEKQRWVLSELLSGKYSEANVYGAARSGKTYLIVYYLTIMCAALKINCLVVRNTFDSIQAGIIAQTMPEVLNAIAKANGLEKYEDMYVNGVRFAKYHRQSRRLLFYNGAYIQFAGMQGSADVTKAYDKILSTQWGVIYGGEVSEIDVMAIDTLRTRCAAKIIRPDGSEMDTMMLYDLNPPSVLHWTYKQFFEHRNSTGELIPEKVWKTYFVVKFVPDDNRENLSSTYYDKLEGNLSTMQKKRYLEGDYALESEGEIFKVINWDKLPDADKFSSCIIYTDPSAKDQKTNDYKASVLLGYAEGKIWFISARAVQGTSLQMSQNIYDLYHESPIPPKVYIEKKQLPIDFDETFKQFCDDHSWPCPLRWDTRNTGDKFTFIESTLEPLFVSKRFIFADTLKQSGVCELAIDQFIRFSKKIQRDRKDDIPDACAKGVSLISKEKRQSMRGLKLIMVDSRKGTIQTMN